MGLGSPSNWARASDVFSGKGTHLRRIRVRPCVSAPRSSGRARPKGSAEHGWGCFDLHTWVDRTSSSPLTLLAWCILEWVNPRSPLGLPILSLVPAAQPVWVIQLLEEKTGGHRGSRALPLESDLGSNLCSAGCLPSNLVTSLCLSFLHCKTCL